MIRFFKGAVSTVAYAIAAYHVGGVLIKLLRNPRAEAK